MAKIGEAENPPAVESNITEIRDPPTAIKLNIDDDDQRPHFPRFPQTKTKRSRVAIAKQSTRSSNPVRRHKPLLRVAIDIASPTVVRNTVTPDQHLRNRVRGAEMEQTLDFCGGRYPLLVRIQSSGGNTLRTPC